MQTKHRFLRRQPRRAAVVAQVAVCSTVLIGLCALVLDIGQMHLARTELQRSADAAALAGASAYAEDEGLIQSDTLGALAYQRALQFSQSNLTLGAPTFVEPADVVAGTLNWQNPQAALDTSGAHRFNA
nr:pilus assembly protein TadG-related protein [Phycisphaerae bacterium]